MTVLGSNEKLSLVVLERSTMYRGRGCKALDGVMGLRGSFRLTIDCCPSLSNFVKGVKGKGVQSHMHGSSDRNRLLITGLGYIILAHNKHMS